VKVVPLDGRTLGAWGRLFERSGCPCFCRYWHFAGNKNDWLARCAEHPELNLEEQRTASAVGSPEASGLVVLDGDAAIGWMKLAPRASLAKLLRQGPYRATSRGATSDDGAVYSIGCLLVDPERRRSGVARALVESAPAFVRASGGSVIEAYPRRIDAEVHDTQAWTGTVRLFTSCGFVECGGDGPYPVMRRSASG
jgi:GNAT superfamily N-acetyltransferase